MGSHSDHTRPDRATREEEQREARMSADSGPQPTAEEERAAERNTVDPDVAETNKEAIKRGAAHPGEGRITQ